jgi:hypothetical protein
MSKQFKLRMQAILVGMLLTLAVLGFVAGVAWGTGVGLNPDVESISGPQVGPGGGGNG